MKVTLGPKNCLYPVLTTLVGANVNGKPNYITIAHVGIMDLGSVSLGMAKFTTPMRESRKTERFSVNIPSVAMVKETDYCGIVSGKKTDKAKLFENFYGKLKTAPMIKQCPINMECKLIQTVDFPKHDIFIGEIVETYMEEQYVTDGAVDYGKVQPIFFSMDGPNYWKLGEQFAKAWHVGKELKKV